VLLTGASGFVGQEVQRQLLREGWQVVAVTRQRQATDVPRGVMVVSADVAGESWISWAKGCTAAIHLVGIIREQPRKGVTFDRLHTELTLHVLRACTELGIHRLVHMSALGARATARTAYHHTKWLAEEGVRSSGLGWTIFRPSVIFGPGDGFTSTLATALRRYPVFPVFGDGRYKVQPISVSEVARCLVAALELPDTEGQTYELGGPEVLTFDEVLQRIARSLGLRRALLHVPLGLARAMVGFLQHFPSTPITSDELTMLLEGSTCDIKTSSLVFSVPQARFEGPTWLRPEPPARPARPDAKPAPSQPRPDVKPATARQTPAAAPAQPPTAGTSQAPAAGAPQAPTPAGAPPGDQTKPS
jgi:uncharacterized protein YbjT (DUF2867 family)